MKLRGHDRVLVAVVAALLVLGLVMVQSASGPEAAERAHDAFYYVKRQAFAMGIGLTLALGIALSPYGWIRRAVWVLYAAVLLGLVLVLVPGIGRSVNGASRWVGVGSFNLQPSEFAKIATMLCLAWSLDRNLGRLNDPKVIGSVLWIPFPLMGLVLAEPDFGTTVIIAGISLMMLFMAGLPTRWVWFLGGATVAVGAPAMMLASYRMRRLRSFFGDPWADAGGTGYQVIQSMIAFHSGGMTGQGLGESHAKHMFLPEPWTDFVSSVLAEELGFIGVLMLMGLYAALVWRGMRIAHRAPDLFGMLLAAGVTLLLAGQALFNLGVAMGVLPTKGLVLPFLSYGGSAVIAHLLCIGLLLNVSAHGREKLGILRPYRRAAVAEGTLA
jgi:cell division protein FtsW